MSEAYTLTDLLNKWRRERLVLMRMVTTDFGDDSPKKNEYAYIMEMQLTQCMSELEAIINKSPLNRAVLRITENRNAHPDRTSPDSSAGVE